MGAAFTGSAFTGSAFTRSAFTRWTESGFTFWRGRASRVGAARPGDDDSQAGPRSWVAEALMGR